MSTAYEIVMQECDRINALPASEKPLPVTALVRVAQRIREETDWLREYHKGAT